MRKKLFRRICTCVIGFCMILMLDHFVIVQGVSDFKGFDTGGEASDVYIGDTPYSVLKTSNGIQALGKNRLTTIPTKWDDAKIKAQQYLSTLHVDQQSMFTKSELPSYQVFSNNRYKGNTQQLNEKMRRGNQNWWLNDTQKIQLANEVNQPGNAIYASRIVSQGMQIDKGKPASSFSYKNFNKGTANLHTIGIQNATASIPESYALNNDYTLGNKNYEYLDLQVKSDIEGRQQGRTQYNFANYDWESYPNSYGSMQTEEVIVRNGTGNTGGTRMKFKDLMDYNNGNISVISELDLQGIHKQNDGRLRINVSQFFSTAAYREPNNKIALKGGKQYILFLSKGYHGKPIEESFVSVEIPHGVTIRLKRLSYRRSAISAAPAMLTTYAMESDVPYWVGDHPFYKGTLVNSSGGTTNADKQVMLYTGENVVYKGPVSNLLDNQGKLSTYIQSTYYWHTNSMPDVGSWGYAVVCLKQKARRNIAELNGWTQHMIYLPHAISKPAINLYLNPGFYQMKYPPKGNGAVYLRLSEYSGSVRSQMIDAYTRKRRGEAIATPFVILSSLNEKFAPYSGNEYNTQGNRGLSLGTYKITEYLPATTLLGEKAFSYPLLTLNTQKIAYVASEGTQHRLDPILKETSNFLKSNTEQQVLFSFTNKVSWKSDVLHLKSENAVAQVGRNGSSIHIQGGNKKIQFKVEGVNDQVSTAHTLYVGAATEDKTGKRVYSRIGKIQGGTATLNIENLMDYKTIGTTKQLRLYIEAITPNAQMNYISESSLPITLDIIEPNHMTLSFPTFVTLNQGKADVNIAIVDYVFFQENVPATFVPSLTSRFQPQDASLPNTIAVKDAKGKADLKLKVLAPESETLKGEAIGVGKTFTYKIYGDGTNGSDSLSTGLWKGLMNVHVHMKLYP